MAEMEITPNKKVEGQGVKNLASGDDVPPVFNNNNDFKLLKSKNGFNAWLKRNRILVGAIVAIVLVLGFVATWVFQQAPTSTVVVQNFNDCVANGGRVLEGTSPRECYFRQVRFIEEIESISEPKSGSEPEPEPEPEVGKPEIEIKRYTHPIFPNLRIDYPSDWKLTEDNTQTGTTILFQKEGITLSYNIAFVDILGEPEVYGDHQASICTNDTTRFLRIGNSDWFRIRLNNGERIYSKNIILKSQGDPSSLNDFQDFLNEMPDPATLAREWVVVLIFPNGLFEACLIGTNNLAGITDTEVPASVPTNTGKRSGLVNIKISGINNNNREVLAEADAIVASTII